MKTTCIYIFFQNPSPNISQLWFTCEIFSVFVLYAAHMLFGASHYEVMLSIYFIDSCQMTVNPQASCFCSCCGQLPFSHSVQAYKHPSKTKKYLDVIVPFHLATEHQSSFLALIQFGPELPPQ